MSFGESVATCFRKYSDFSGRAGLAEFWWFFLFTWLVNLGLMAAAVPSMARRGGGGVGVLWLVSLALLLPYLAVAVRRLHDTGRSGATMFLALIPMIGAIVLLVFLASSGTGAPNRYGDPAEGRAEQRGYSSDH